VEDIQGVHNSTTSTKQRSVDQQFKEKSVIGEKPAAISCYPIFGVHNIQKSSVIRATTEGKVLTDIVSSSIQQFKEEVSELFTILRRFFKFTCSTKQRKRRILFSQIFSQANIVLCSHNQVRCTSAMNLKRKRNR
jgi:hypothetical protein